MEFNYRQMNHKDVKDVARMCYDFYLESSINGLVPWDHAYICENLHALVDNADFFGLVAMDKKHVAGFITAIKTPSTFYKGYMASEQVFWIDPPYRKTSMMPLRLLRSFKQWAKDTDCKVFTMGADAKNWVELEGPYKLVGLKPGDMTYWGKVI